ncbi:MAG TPA: hypothetical protein VHJ19_11040 [Gammaproteobacteria bacterium]|nr:hypothetical protein [Gammaproteobacteria bacterium]
MTEIRERPVIDAKIGIGYTVGVTPDVGKVLAAIGIERSRDYDLTIGQDREGAGPRDAPNNRSP